MTRSQEQLVYLLMGITIPSYERTGNDPGTIVATGSNGHIHVVHIDIENGHSLFRCTHGYYFSNRGTFLLSELSLGLAS